MSNAPDRHEGCALAASASSDDLEDEAYDDFQVDGQEEGDEEEGEYQATVKAGAVAGNMRVQAAARHLDALLRYNLRPWMYNEVDFNHRMLFGDV